MADLDAGDAGRDLAEEDPVPVKLETAELESLQGTPHQRLYRLKQKGPVGQGMLVHKERTCRSRVGS